MASAFHKTRYYTQGCDKLLVCTDHKPLLGVLNDRSLESIDNPRLLRLKEKTLGSRFKIIHIHGRKLCGPDALSQAVTTAQGEVQMITSSHEDRGVSASNAGFSWLDLHQPCQGESCFNLQAGPTDNSPGWGSLDSVEMEDYELTTKDAREGPLGGNQSCYEWGVPSA